MSVSPRTGSPKSPKKLAQEQATLDEAHEAFRLISGDSDRIDARKLESSLKNLGFSTDPQLIHEMISQLDQNEKGFVTLSEFLDLLKGSEPAADPKEEIEKAFRQIKDENESNISFSALKKAITEIGETLPESEIQEMISEADRDGDGQVSREEFMRVMFKAQSL